MFLQLQVPEQDRSCLRFQWRPRTNEPVQIYENQSHVFGAKSSTTRANYALKRVGLDNEEIYLIAAKAKKTTSTLTISSNRYKNPEETPN